MRTPTPVSLSKALLTCYLNAVETYTAQMDPHQVKPDLRVLRKSVARVVFGDKRSAAKELSAREGTEPVGKDKRPPTPLRDHELAAILNAAKNLLWRQFNALQPRFPIATPDQFEEAFCKDYGIPSNRMSVEHFDLSHAIHAPISTGPTAIPNLLSWTRDDCGFDPRTRCGMAMERLRSARTAIRLAPDDGRRLDLLFAAVNAAALFHPGDAQHAIAQIMARDAADAAGLQRLVSDHDESTRMRATHLSGQLQWLSFLPHLESPTNYVRHLLSGKRMPPHVWRQVEHALERATIDARAMVAMRPGDGDAIRHLVSVTSMKARLLLATDVGPDARADAAYAESAALVESSALPYGFLYPILRSTVRGDLRGAADQCEGAIGLLQRGHDARSARAFGALLFHISALQGNGTATTDSTLVEHAELCVSSPSIVFTYSHVFDVDEVRRLLRSRKRRSTRGRG